MRCSVLQRVAACCVTSKCHVRISHVARMNQSCRTFESFMSHVWISHATHMNFYQTWFGAALLNPVREQVLVCVKVFSHRILRVVMSRVWMRHVTRMNVARHTCLCKYVWIQMCMNASIHECKCVCMQMCMIKYECNMYECICVWMYMNANACACKCIWIQMYMNANIYKCKCTWM